MNGPDISSDTAAGTLGPIAVTGPAGAARARLALDPRIRRKFETLEAEAEDALALVRAVTDRLNDARRALAAVERRIYDSEQASRHRHDPGRADLEVERTDLMARIARLEPERDAAHIRWQNASRLVASCKQYLNL